MREIFEFFGKEARSCPVCGEKLRIEEIRPGGANLVGVFRCRKDGCRFQRLGAEIFRAVNPQKSREVLSLLPAGERKVLERKISAATAAVIRCGDCGAKRRYIETAVFPDGKILHRFECREKNCRKKGSIISIELTDADCERIFRAAAEGAKCRICGKTAGAKVLCGKADGYICEEHCRGCGFLFNETSSRHCVWWERQGREEAARKGFEEYAAAELRRREI